MLKFYCSAVVSLYLQIPPNEIPSTQTDIIFMCRNIVLFWSQRNLKISSKYFGPCNLIIHLLKALSSCTSRATDKKTINNFPKFLCRLNRVVNLSILDLVRILNLDDYRLLLSTLQFLLLDVLSVLSGIKCCWLAVQFVARPPMHIYILQYSEFYEY